MRSKGHSLRNTEPLMELAQIQSLCDAGVVVRGLGGFLVILWEVSDVRVFFG
ncbi:MAG: hypothetical protein IPK04_16960 [Bdellovibrionales bacterium]|nr:hypothetical protein [Bdellovibrionales bacterium]